MTRHGSLGQGDGFSGVAPVAKRNTSIVADIDIDCCSKEPELMKIDIGVILEALTPLFHVDEECRTFADSSKQFRLCLVLGLLCIGCCDSHPQPSAASVSPALAAPVVIDIPMKAPKVLEHAAETHARMEVESDEDSSHSFNVMVPKDWIQRKAPANFRQAVFSGRALATFAPEPKPGAGGAVAVIAILTPITNDVPVDAWARATFEQEGYSIINARWFPGPHGLFFDITGRRADANGEVVRRSTVRQDGARFFSLNTISPPSQWNEVKENFWAAHVTFELLHPRGGSAEERRQIDTRDPAFRVEYPASWEAEVAKSRDRGVSGIHIRLPTADKTDLAAYLLVRAEAAAESGSAALLEQALKIASKSGVTPQGQPQPLTEAEDPRTAAVEGWIGGYSVPAHMGNADVTLKLGFVRRGDLNFTFVLCSPKSTTDLLSALRAQRTLEIVRARLELPTNAPKKKRSH